jgi:hypothetical protein
MDNPAGQGSSPDCIQIWGEATDGHGSVGPWLSPKGTSSGSMALIAPHSWKGSGVDAIASWRLTIGTW